MMLKITTWSWNKREFALIPRGHAGTKEEEVSWGSASWMKPRSCCCYRGYPFLIRVHQGRRWPRCTVSVSVVVHMHGRSGVPMPEICIISFDITNETAITAWYFMIYLQVFETVLSRVTTTTTINTTTFTTTPKPPTSINNEEVIWLLNGIFLAQIAAICCLGWLCCKYCCSGKVRISITMQWFKNCFQQAITVRPLDENIQIGDVAKSQQV